MKIQLSLKEKNVTLVLLDEEKNIEEKTWVDENNLLEIFFPALDEMLTNHDLDVSGIDEFVLETNIPKGYTTARIARTIVKTLNFARKS